MDKYRQSICGRRVSDNYLMNHEYSSSSLIALHIPDESSPALSDLSRKLSMYEDLFAPVRRLYIFHIESSFLRVPFHQAFFQNYCHCSKPLLQGLSVCLSSAFQEVVFSPCLEDTGTSLTSQGTGQTGLHLWSIPAIFSSAGYGYPLSSSGTDLLLPCRVHQGSLPSILIYIHQ